MGAGMLSSSSAAEVCGADEGRYNTGAVLPQGASDVQSIRASQTADPRAKQTYPSGPAQRSARVNTRPGGGDSPCSALSFGRSGGEFSEPAPFGWPSSALDTWLTGRRASVWASGLVTTKTLRRRFFSIAGRLTRSARRLTLHLPQRWPWENQFSRALAWLRAIPLPA